MLNELLGVEYKRVGEEKRERGVVTASPASRVRTGTDTRGIRDIGKERMEDI